MSAARSWVLNTYRDILYDICLWTRYRYIGDICLCVAIRFMYLYICSVPHIPCPGRVLALQPRVLFENTEARVEQLLPVGGDLARGSALAGGLAEGAQRLLLGRDLHRVAHLLRAALDHLLELRVAVEDRVRRPALLDERIADGDGVAAVSVRLLVRATLALDDDERAIEGLEPSTEEHAATSINQRLQAKLEKNTE